MIRQSKKSNEELMQWYLDLCGADPGAYKLCSSFPDVVSISYMCRVGTRLEQIETINKINEFDGIVYILVYFKGNERVENNLFLNTLNIYWDNSKEAKRSKRLQKIKAKIIS